MDYKEKALETFANNFNCSQSVLVAFAEELGLDEKSALKIGGCFGAGMCTGEICGSVVGALMAIGLKYGHCHPDDTDSKIAANHKTIEMINQFKEQNGSILCRDLLGYDVNNPEELVMIKDMKLFTTFCPKMVESAVNIADNIINPVKLK